MAASSSNLSMDTDDDEYEVSSDSDNSECVDEYEQCGAQYDDIVFSDSDLEVTREEWITIGTRDFGDYKSEVELDEDYKEDCPEEYQRFLDLCELALSHYNKTHAGETYEFVSVEKAKVWFNGAEGGVEYTLTMSTKNLKGNNIETMEAIVINYKGSKGDGKKVVSCDLLGKAI